jgi:hypothetical protein
MDSNEQEIDFDDESCANMHTEPSKEAVSEILSTVPAPETQTSLLDAPPASCSDPTNGYKEPEQIELLHVPEWHEEHWKQMPQFEQKNLMPWKTVKVHFENREGMNAFAKLIGQQINLTTQFVWYPEAELAAFAHLRWVDAPEPEQDADEELIETIED